jgi:hypothetical protein
MSFPVYNVQFEVLADENYIGIKGQITNETTRSYSTALFKIFVHNRETVIYKGNIKVHELHAGQTKSFEAILEIHRSRIPKISAYEIIFEQGF